MDDARELKVRQAFQVLTQGVEMFHYDTRNSYSAYSEKIVWMDPEILRVCVDIVRPSLRDRNRGKVSPGLYLRDIGEVREGARAFDFLRSSRPPTPDEDETCLSLIGTERTICLRLKSKVARDWFIERFEIVIDDVLTEMERRERRALRSALHGHTLREPRSAAHVKEVLMRGIQVLHHHPSEEIVESIMSFNEEDQRLMIRPIRRNIFDFSDRSMGLAVDDVAEIRLGTHSVGFVGTDSTSRGEQCLSVIGTECTLDIELANRSSRDLFSRKLRAFVDAILTFVEDDDTSQA